MPSRPQGIVPDVLLALALTGAMVAELIVSDDPRSGLTVLNVALLAVAATPVVVRRQRPGLALVAAMAALFVVIPVTDIYQTVPFPSMVAGYSLALVVDRRRTIYAGLALAPFVLLSLLLYSEDGLLDWEVPKNLSFVALPLLLGVAVRNRRAYQAALVERAETAERSREEEALRRVGEERLRIARDVHDVVAHAMVAINVQAGVGAHLLDRDPDRARATLLDIKRVSGEALADLRSTLGVLRTTDDVDEVPVHPAQTIRELEDLGASLRSAGLELELDIDPDATSLPAPVDATGYRIVQEALTNVLRHAGSARARVSVQRESDRVVISVEDDGAGSRPPGAGDETSGSGSGNGVRGMRERALAVGGTLEAGPSAEGGWRVHATIPLATAPVTAPVTTP